MLSAAKWGALVGVAMYIILEVISIISLSTLGPGSIDPNHPGQITLGCLELLIILFAFSTSGFYAGRETRQAGLGAIAGMVTFAVYGVLLSIYSYGRTSSSGVSGGTIGQQVVIELISVTLYLVIAALIGWLGGRPGATQGRARAARLAQEKEAPKP